MSVKIRLRRMGKKKQPHYRIVVADSRAPRDGRFVENLGYYNPVKHPATLSVDMERVEYWVGQGAIVSDTVRSLVSRARAGGDDLVALVGADETASAEAAAANGATAEAPAAAEPDGGDESGASATEATADKADEAAEPPEAAAEDSRAEGAGADDADGADDDGDA